MNRRRWRAPTGMVFLQPPQVWLLAGHRPGVGQRGAGGDVAVVVVVVIGPVAHRICRNCSRITPVSVGSSLSVRYAAGTQLGAMVAGSYAKHSELTCGVSVNRHSLAQQTAKGADLKSVQRKGHAGALAC